MRWGGKVGMKQMTIVTVNSDERESDREAQKLIGKRGRFSEISISYQVQ